ncbi:hypothetical protein DPEC_G00292180 [Dallia pectoralis]|uniref:Uncharacterized protein n=1 Tax=Dallia pectoralis TaxID=75939 RepID=A0ACC2FHX9_DALPE|nr:hypothetical protein DPEC_G00292180 [Dallia pectoralis]
MSDITEKQDGVGDFMDDCAGVTWQVLIGVSSPPDPSFTQNRPQEENRPSPGSVPGTFQHHIVMSGSVLYDWDLQQNV